MDAGLSPSPGGDPGRKSGKKDGGDADQPVGKDKVKVWDPKDPILRKVLAKEEAGDEAVHPKKTMYQILRGGNVRKLPPSQSHADVAWPSPPEDRVPPAEESNLPDGQHWVGDCPKKPQLHANDDPEMNLLMNELKEAVISREGSQQQGLLSGRFSGSLRMKDKPRTSSLWTMDTPSLNSYGRLSIEDEHDTGSFDDHDEECDSDYGSSLDDEISLGDEDEVNSNGLDAMAATIPFVNYLGMKIHQSRGVYKSGKPKRFERLKKSMVRGING